MDLLRNKTQSSCEHRPNGVQTPKAHRESHGSQAQEGDGDLRTCDRPKVIGFRQRPRWLLRSLLGEESSCRTSGNGLESSARPWDGEEINARIKIIKHESDGKPETSPDRTI